MTLEDIRLLYSYDRWANRRVFAAATKLNQEQFTRELGGGFPSLRQTLIHIIGGEWIWLRYWDAIPVSEEAVSRLKAQRDAEFDAVKFADLSAVQAKWAEVEKQQTDFLEKLSEDALHRLIEFRGTRVEVWHLMQHLANHSTYHRGQISLMMRQVGAEPAATDFHVFVVEQKLASSGPLS